MVALLLLSALASAEPPPAESVSDENALLSSVYPSVEFSLAVGSQTWVPSLSFNALYAFGREKKFHAGLGLRASAFLGYGHSLTYSTADAGLIENGQINTLSFSGMKTFSFNAVLHLKYRAIPKLEFGLNIDLIGVGFGGPGVGSYAATDPAQSGPQQARPATFNLLLGGNRDRGQLNSEFYVGYSLAPDWWVRAGFSHFFSEVQSDIPRDFGNNRFRHIANLLFVSASHQL